VIQITNLIPQSNEKSATVLAVEHIDVQAASSPPSSDTSKSDDDMPSTPKKKLNAPAPEGYKSKRIKTEN